MSSSKISRREFTRLISLSSASAALVLNMPQAMAKMLESSLPSTGIDNAELLKGFKNTPVYAKPWTYYMWLNGNISKEGITHDMEALHRIGVGGVLIMSLGQVQEGPVRFLSPEWRGLVKHTIAEAERLGMQVNMNNDAGWNSGGPWITPELGMQKLTWTETFVSGPSKFTDKLPQGATQLNTYKDIAVWAIPSRKTPDIPQDFKITEHKGAQSWLQHDYGKSITAQSIIVSHPKVNGETLDPAFCEVSVSDDGSNFKTIRGFHTTWLGTYLILKTTSARLGKVTGRYFRLTFPGITSFPQDLSFTLLPEPLIDNWLLKAGFESATEHGGEMPIYAMPEKFPAAMDGEFPATQQMINLSGKMKADGSLAWDVPKGDWLIIRAGYTPTAKTNGAAGDDGRGLDCDKVSKKALEVHLAGMVDKVIADAGPMAGKNKTLSTVHTDSWESQQFSWTADLPEEFKKRRGYDIIPWLPVMTGGRIVNSVEQSERFLWDLRRTLADMIMDNHLKYFHELAHKRGLLFTSESSGRGQFLYDPIAFQVCSDLPMGEFWNSPQESRPRPDCKIAASAAHVANLPVAGGEAFTQNKNDAGKWLESPYFLKTLGDSAFCAGLNRYYFHRTIAQYKPDQKPGMTWPNVGINFDTTNTWWDQGKEWVKYITRCQYLLQQGRFVADAAIITDEGAPAAAMRKLPYEKPESVDPGGVTELTLKRFDMMPYLPPAGHDYDYIHPGAVHSMVVKNGEVVLPHGMSYKVLVLPNSLRMTLKLAKKIKELVEAGATVIGPKPLQSPTLSDFNNNGDKELAAITATLWGNDKALIKQSGKGRIYKGNATAQALASLRLSPDFEYSVIGKTKLPLQIDYIHRRTENADIYFISNQQHETVDISCLFRVSGRQPELWFADTGEVVPCQAFEQIQGRTKLPLRLDPAGSVFVVFTKVIAKTTAGTAKTNFADVKPVAHVKGSWTINFDTRWGGPETHSMPELTSWAESRDAGVKYYSGTATYKKRITITPVLLKHKHLFIDLGVVKELATVKVNDKEAGVLWKPPYRVNIHALLKPGENELEIAVTNLWPNRLIGDAGLPEEKRYTKVNWNPYKPDSPLLESGLIGPVTLQA